MIPLHKKIQKIEDVVDDTLVVVDVVMVDMMVVDMVVVDTIDDHVRFGTYHRPNFDHQSLRDILLIA